MPAPLSVIIPTLNAADLLPETAEHLLSGATEGLIRELIISDGGSADTITCVAKELGATFLEGAPGRGGQVARGLEAATAPWLLILHADTHLGNDWTQAARDHMNSHADKAGYFRLRFRAKGLAPRVIELGANLRSRVFDLPYGDQGLLISRELLNEIGGYPEIPLMEDVALAKLLKGRLRELNATAQTSAERYHRDGWTRRALKNLGTLVRYRLGANPDALARRYNRER